MNEAEESGERAAEQLKAAARAVLLERGAVGAAGQGHRRARPGIAPSSVLYYYPDIGDLLLDVARGAMERYAEERAAAVREVDGATARLRLAISLGVPTGPEDEDSRLLYEIDALTGTSPAFEVLSAAFFDRQVHLYESLIEAGVAAGELEPAATATDDRPGHRRDGGRARPPGRARPRRDRPARRRERILLEYAGGAGRRQSRGRPELNPAPASPGRGACQSPSSTSWAEPASLCSWAPGASLALDASVASEPCSAAPSLRSAPFVIGN